MRLFLFLLITTPGILHAQYDDLLRNSKISWVAEYTADFEFNPVYNDYLDAEYNLLRVIRLENTRGKSGFFGDLEMSRYFSQVLLDGLNTGQYACFADDQLKQPLTAEQVQRLLQPSVARPGFDHPFDTIVMVIPVEASAIDLFRARQVIYFDQKKQLFGSRLLAFAPVVNRMDEEGNIAERRPVFWIKCAAGKEATSTKDRDASYIFQTYMKDNAPSIEQMQVKKGRLNLQAWAAEEVDRPSHACFSYDGFVPLDKTALRELVFSTDTLVTINEDDQAVIDRIVQTNALLQVEKIRFVQDWVFDERRHTLICRVRAAAPLAAVRDDEGVFRYYKPLFYIRY